MLSRKMLTVIAICIGIGAALWAGTRFLSATWFSFALWQEGASIGEATAFTSTKRNQQSIEAVRGADIVRVTVIPRSVADARQYVREQTTLLNGIFETQRPPYPEFLTQESGCAERYKPVEYHADNGVYVTLYASERLGYGVCAEDLIYYRVSIGFFYCSSSQKVFKVEYFTDRGASTDVLKQWNESFQCRGE